jgi:hypothetical protein
MNDQLDSYVEEEGLDEAQMRGIAIFLLALVVACVCLFGAVIWLGTALWNASS